MMQQEVTTDIGAERPIRDDEEIVDALGIESGYLVALKHKAQSFLDEEDFDNARAVLEYLYELDRRDVMVLLALAKCALEDGATRTARAYVEQARRHDPENTECVVSDAEIELAVGDLARAQWLLEPVFAGDPRHDKPATRRAAAMMRRVGQEIGRLG